MKCPFCGHQEDKVMDSRPSKGGSAIRRRRECLKCEKRFTTYEQIEEILPMVVKRDGRREPFDRSENRCGYPQGGGEKAGVVRENRGRSG